MRDKNDEAVRFQRMKELKQADERLADALTARVQAGNALLIDELRHFATWVPGMYPHPLHDGDEPNEESDAVELQRMCEAPFLSEAYLYNLMGKEEGRTVLALFNSLCRAAGVSGGADELQEPWYKAQHEADLEAVTSMRSRMRPLREAGHTFTAVAEGCPACLTTAASKRPSRSPDGCSRRATAKRLEEAEARLLRRWDETL